jgi:hypothetical protein
LLAEAGNVKQPERLALRSVDILANGEPAEHLRPPRMPGWAEANANEIDCIGDMGMTREKEAMPTLTLLMGTPVTDVHGKVRGRVADLAVGTGRDAGKVMGLIL